MRSIKAIPIVACLTLATPARAQILSPGKLGQSHAKLEGLSQCTQCHELGKKVDGARCLICHKILGDLIKHKKGFHGQGPASLQPCIHCHRDHRGRKGALVEWTTAKKNFAHPGTGFRLQGKHQKAKCKDCHRARLTTNVKLKKRLQDHAESTYLGLSQECSNCHFDEHRGQFKAGCQQCHTPKEFSKAPGFDHQKSWLIDGAHKRVECSKCHPMKDVAAPEHPVSTPKSTTHMAQYKGVGKDGCIGCHRDVHAGKFGKQCKRCHTTARWSRTTLARGDVAFHQKTRFPLKGRHRQAKCTSCHPRQANGKLQQRGLHFAHCNDCHLDAHFDQMPKKKDSNGSYVPCDRCHNENGFYPTRFPLEQHDKTDYPLRGSHRSVACNGCHVPDRKRFSASVPPELRNPTTPLPGNRLLNFTRIRMPELDLKKCSGCHTDPHGGQFDSQPKKLCRDCHTVERFAPVKLNHDRDTQFPLRGKHIKTECIACHKAARPPTTVSYRGLSKRCADCHQDPHQGQFENTECKQCHDETDFKKTSFSHDDSKRQVFRLTGKHIKTACEKCHPLTEPRDRQATHWYRGVPVRCDGCHTNIHGQMQKRSGAAP